MGCMPAVGRGLAVTGLHRGGWLETYEDCLQPWCFGSQKLLQVKILFLSLPVESSLTKSLETPGGGQTTESEQRLGGNFL